MSRPNPRAGNPNDPDWGDAPMVDPGHTHTTASSGIGGGVVRQGAGAPGAGVGAIGDLYYRTDGSTGSTLLYIKTGASTWTATAA